MHSFPETLFRLFCIVLLLGFRVFLLAACGITACCEHLLAPHQDASHLTQVRARFPGKRSPGSLFYKRLPNLARFSKFLAPSARSAFAGARRAPLPSPGCARRGALPQRPGAQLPSPAARSGDAIAKYLPAPPCASLRPRWRAGTSLAPG